MPISIAPFAAPQGQPTYTDIFNATLGAVPDPASLDVPLIGASSIVLQLGGEIDSGVLDGDIVTLGNIGGAFDPTSLDTNVGNYVAAVPLGAARLNDVGGIAIPALLQLPISAAFNGSLSAPPTQTNVNLGTMPLGGKPLSILLGSYLTVKGRLVNYITASIADGDPAIFGLVHTSTYNANTNNGSDTFTFVVTPSKPGTFLCQLDLVGGVGAAGTIFTYTVTVQ